jgi:hypothetical protein
MANLLIFMKQHEKWFGYIFKTLRYRESTNMDELKKENALDSLLTGLKNDIATRYRTLASKITTPKRNIIMRSLVRVTFSIGGAK